ncbi:MAG TPA: DUF6125 family protein, partial [Candidatus Lokiarchaeia archaeon]
MTLYDQLNKKELKELLVKCWMTHDGMWFQNTFLTCGIKVANKLNKGAIRSLAQIESVRIRRAHDRMNENIDSFERLKVFIDDGLSMFKGDFMNFEYTFPEENIMHWEMNKCWAYEGMKKLGVADKYDCGVIYRIKC